MLRISPDHPGAEYIWFECTKKFLWICSEKTQRKEIYDFNDPSVRQKLIATGFVLQILEK